MGLDSIKKMWELAKLTDIKLEPYISSKDCF
jgi:hypothetical protein